MILAKDSEFKKFQILIEKRIGLKFPVTKKSLLEGRLSQRIIKLNLKSFSDYYSYINKSENSDEYKFFINKITTHTTSFFREDHHFDFLKQHTIPDLNLSHSNQTIEVLSLGCSTGEEIYTLAMVLTMEQRNGKINDFIINGADISRDSLLTAKEGIYKKNHLGSVPRQYRQYVSVDGDHVHMKNILKNNIRFFILNACKKGQQFPGTYHIIFCRNMLIYFSKPLQQNVIGNIQSVLRPGGSLFVGHAESLYGLKHDFTKIEPTIYKRSNND